MSSFRLERHCECGGELIIESDDFKVVQLGDSQFKTQHLGDGHGATTKRKAARARRRQLIKDAEEWGRDER